MRKFLSLIESYKFFDQFIDTDIYKFINGEKVFLGSVNSPMKLELTYKIIYFFTNSVLNNLTNESSPYHIKRTSHIERFKKILDFLKLFKENQEKLEFREFVDFCLEEKDAFKECKWKHERNIASLAEKDVMFDMIYCVYNNFLPSVAAYYLGHDTILNYEDKLVQSTCYSLVRCLMTIRLSERGYYDIQADEEMSVKVFNSFREFVISEFETGEILFYTTL